MDNKISIIVPAYNIAPYLERCVSSILAQTHRDLEVIVVNDGSTDDTGAVLDRLAAADCRIKAIHKENGGVTSARLRGIEEASGSWIGFVDGDDCIEPQMYARLLRNALEHHADISHCGYQMVFDDGRIHCFHDSGLVKEQDSDTAVRDLLEGTLVEPGLWNKLCRRELFEGLAQRMDTSIRINEDLLMNYYLFRSAQTAVFDDWCPYHYIVRAGSASRAKPNAHKIYDPIRVREIILADAPEQLRPDAERALVQTCVYCYCGLLTRTEALFRTARREIRKKLRAHSSAAALLPGRSRLMAELIIRAPWLFRLAYPVYYACFQKKKYD